MIRKFRVKATRLDEYVIELDDEIINEEWMAEYSKTFSPIDSLKEVAENLAYSQLRLGSEGNARFIEGFGPVLRDGRMPFSFNDFDNAGNWLPEEQREQPAPGINIVIDTEDEDYEFETEEETGS